MSRSSGTDPREAEVREALVAMSVNTAVWLARLVMGLMTGSMALIADAWHALSDNITSVAVLVGSRVASKPPDESHPYGHGRFADVVSLVIGLGLVGLAAYIVFEAVTRFVAGYTIVSTYAEVAILVVIATSLAKEFLARYALKLHNLSGSPLCRADAWHHRVDALTCLAVIPVFIASLLGEWSALTDLAASALISALLAKEGFEIVKDATLDLMDTSRKELIRIVERAALSVDGVEEVHDVRVRSYGGMYYVDMKIHVGPDLSVEEAHRVAERVEETVKRALGPGRVVEVLIHYEPTTPHN